MNAQRTASGTVVLTVRLTLDPDRDADLLAVLQAAPPRGLAAAIRNAMRTGLIRPAQVGEDDAVLDLSGLSSYEV